ncbi:PolC-type DNA polymerase III N-terminal domain-containing protein [Tissierella carlieri]|uniref:PolC-type DNA polymerase III N-terminal domain-containing protein n=1 Tax=Tissierella carlieri TaxID=689904 RepID=UPI003869FF20
MKRINEIFNDYEAKGNINTATVEGVVLRKDDKTLEMKIRTDKYIEIREIEGLNDFIKERFSLNDSKIIVEYAEEIDKMPIEEELRDIIFAMSDKYPVLNAIKNNCEFEVFENTINLNFKIPASNVLRSMGYNRKIRNTIKKFYGTEYEINFVDKICNEEFKRLQEDVYSNEIMLIQKRLRLHKVTMILNFLKKL